MSSASAACRGKPSRHAIGPLLLLTILFAVWLSAPLKAEDPTSNSPSANVPAGPAVAAPAADQRDPARLSIVIYDPKVASEAENSLREAFQRSRAEFLDDLFLASKHRKLTPEQTKSPGFQRFVTWFQKKAPSFPLTSGLAQSWASGETVDDPADQWAGALRAVMTNYIVESWIASAEVRPVYASAANQAQTASFVCSNFLSISEGRVEVFRNLGLVQPQEGKYVCSFLRPNCLLEAVPALTSVDSPPPAASAVIHYSPPVTEPVDSGWRTNAERELATVRDWLQRLLVMLEERGSQHPLVMACGAIAAFAAVFWIIRSRRRLPGPVEPRPTAYTVIINSARNETIFLPANAEALHPAAVAATASSGALVPTEPASPAVLLAPPEDPAWETRILASEKRAQELMARIRAGLAPHLAQAMVNELVQRLLMDRAALLEAQDLATAELKDIEARFEHVQEELAERLRAYQSRNSELERELANRSVENRELLKAQMGWLGKQTG